MTRRSFRVNADSWTVLRDLLVATPEEFNGDYRCDGDRHVNTISGRRMNVGRRSVLGQLPDEWRAVWHNQEIDYVIYSYGTPIAWRTREAHYGNNGLTYSHRWVVPDVRYSVTTSKHQGKVRTALSQITGGI
jgi:hypothetical protein